MRILGIDPGTITMGYGVIEVNGEEVTMVDCAALDAPQSSNIGERLNSLHQRLLEIISRYKPDVVAVEQPFMAKNVKATLAIGMAQGIALLAAASKGIPIYEYTPAQVKQRVANYGGSSKGQVQEMVKIQLRLPHVPEPSDAADALAVALCHLQETHLDSLLAKLKGNDSWSSGQTTDDR
jgi:crossover junction endodeoxyribonuclease RuvC